MADYAIGDVQGCYSVLLTLLEKIQFDSSVDTLWFTGDLVNRGPDSLQTLRFIKSLGDKHHIVLGNHDLHLLALAYKAHAGWEEDTLDEILQTPDCDELVHWLRQKPLMYHDDKLGFTMVHAGLAPQWDLATAKALAHEVEVVLKSNDPAPFLQNMYGDQPNLWQPDLKGFDRLRAITNYFTRMRLCDKQGRLELSRKGKLNTQEQDLMPWFKVPHRANASLNILFGHWAALGGVTNTPNVHALDTGCIWGYALTAMCLQDGKRHAISCD